MLLVFCTFLSIISPPYQASEGSSKCLAIPCAISRRRAAVRSLESSPKHSARRVQIAKPIRAKLRLWSNENRLVVRSDHALGQSNLQTDTIVSANFPRTYTSAWSQGVFLRLSSNQVLSASHWVQNWCFDFGWIQFCINFKPKCCTDGNSEVANLMACCTAWADSRQDLKFSTCVEIGDHTEALLCHIL